MLVQFQTVRLRKHTCIKKGTEDRQKFYPHLARWIGVLNWLTYLKAEWHKYVLSDFKAITSPQSSLLNIDGSWKLHYLSLSTICRAASLKNLLYFCNHLQVMQPQGSWILTHVSCNFGEPPELCIFSEFPKTYDAPSCFKEEMSVFGSNKYTPVHLYLELSDSVCPLLCNVLWVLEKWQKCIVILFYL